MFILQKLIKIKLGACTRTSIFFNKAFVHDRSPDSKLFKSFFLLCIALRYSTPSLTLRCLNLNSFPNTRVSSFSISCVHLTQWLCSRAARPHWAPFPNPRRPTLSAACYSLGNLSIWRFRATTTAINTMESWS